MFNAMSAEVTQSNYVKYHDYQRKYTETSKNMYLKNRVFGFVLCIKCVFLWYWRQEETDNEHTNKKTKQVAGEKR